MQECIVRKCKFPTTAYPLTLKIVSRDLDPILIEMDLCIDHFEALKDAINDHGNHLIQEAGVFDLD